MNGIVRATMPRSTLTLLDTLRRSTVSRCRQRRWEQALQHLAALKFLWPNHYGGYWDFCEKFFKVELNPWSAYGKDFSGEKYPGMVRRGAPSYHEVSQAEANPELPGVVVRTTFESGAD